MSSVWTIEARDGLDIVWRAELPFGRYSERHIEDLLRLLIAKAELSFDEIVASTGRKRRSRAALLDIHRQMKPFVLMGGSGWSFTARVRSKP
jgi:hypothetical protein